MYIEQLTHEDFTQTTRSAPVTAVTERIHLGTILSRSVGAIIIHGFTPFQYHVTLEMKFFSTPVVLERYPAGCGKILLKIKKNERRKDETKRKTA